MARRKPNLNAIGLKTDNFEITQGETLSGKDFEKFTSDVIRARFDPMWFMKTIIKWEPYPKQEEIIREFYRDKYNPELQEYKKLIAKCGQRCASRYTQILTKEFGHISIEEVYNKFHSGVKLHAKNENGWVLISNAFYVGFKIQYKLLTSDKKTINCSIDHKFLVNDKWIPLKDIKSGDVIRCFDSFEQKFYDSIVVGWDKEEFTIEMYDLHVPDGNCYVANGILSHNSGKTVSGSKIASYEFFELATCSFTQTPAQYYGLMRGQPIGINCVSAGKEQAMMGIFSLMKIDIDDNEWFNQWFDINIVENKIEIRDKNIYAMVSAAKADTGAGTGTTSKAVFGDEVDLWQRTDSKAGAEIVWSKLVNSTQTLGDDGKCIAISSTQYPDGMISRLYEQGSKERKTLVYDLCTWEMNPKIKEVDLREEFKYRMDQFYRDFANQPNVSGGLQFPEGISLDKTIANVLQVDYDEAAIQRLKGKVPPHVMAIDPAWRNDSFGIGCGCFKGGFPFIDGVRKFRKENKEDEILRPKDIRNFVIPAIKALNVDTFLYDTDLAPELVEYINDDMGVEVIKHIVDKKDYDRWRELQDAEEIRVVYDEFLENECNQLVVQVTESGKRRTQHTRYGSKDLSDTVANCIWYLEEYQPEYSYTPLGPMIFV